MDTTTKYLPILLLMVATSCQGGPVLPAASPTLPSWGHIPASSTPSILPASPEPLSSTPTAHSILHPDISVACPAPAKVSFAELGLPAGVGILITDSHFGSGTVFSVSGSEPSPALLFKLPSTSREFYDLVGSSPDGRLLLIERVATSDPERSVHNWDLLIRSSNGQEEWALGRVAYEGDFYNGQLTITSDGSPQALTITGVKFGPSTAWLTSSQVAIYSQGMEASSASMPYPVAALDVITRKAVPFFDTLDLIQAIPSDHYVGSYDANRERLHVFIDLLEPGDPATYAFIFVARPSGRDGILFPWVNAAGWMDSHLMARMRTWVWQDSGGLFNLAVTQTFGIDLSLNLTLDEATTQGQYGERMLSIAVPPGSGYPSPSTIIDVPNIRITWISRDGHLLGIERQLHDGIRSFLLDAVSFRIREYCGNLPSVYAPMESPDGRFLLWNVESSPFPDSIMSAVILDLHTGRFAILGSARALGWVVGES
jgi:hypothetical protein